MRHAPVTGGAAFFHDLLEDTDATEEEIAQMGGPEVLAAVKALAKQPGYVMADYVAGVRIAALLCARTLSTCGLVSAT